MSKRHPNIYAAIEHSPATVTRQAIDGEAVASVNVSDGSGGVLSAEVLVREVRPGVYRFAAYWHDSGKLPETIAERTLEVAHRKTD